MRRKDGCKRYYRSMRFGNYVRSPFGVLYQMVESLVKYHEKDFRWRRVWLAW